jgi:hypothetical protein
MILRKYHLDVDPRPLVETIIKRNAWGARRPTANQKERPMSRKVGFGAAAVAAAFLAAVAVRVAPLGATPLTSGELKCETSTGKAQSQFVAFKGKCIQKCESDAAKGKVASPSDCDPNGGSADASCISAAVGKTVHAEQVKCAGGAAPSGSCPLCYGEDNGDPNNAHSGDCVNDSITRTSDPNNPNSTETQVDPFFSIIWCDSGATDPNNANQKVKLKCENSLSKNASKLVSTLNKCVAKCLASAAKGKSTGHCAPPVDGGSDTKLASCVSAAKAKLASQIDKSCPSGTITCTNGDAIGAALYAGSGADWANVVEGRVNAQYPNTYCSASGAFLE